MNIFVLSRHVRHCAQQHCDRHVVKMPVETAQLLSTAMFAADPEAWSELHSQGRAYRPTHASHPCALWAGGCLNNYLWLARLGLELCTEYSYRYGKRHKSEDVIAALRQHAPALPRQHCISPFPLVMPEEFQVPGDPVGSYRRYYQLAKAPIARWTKREAPAWFQLSPEMAQQR